MPEKDLRTRRTHKLIQQTFREMLEEMDYERITIKELTRRANINRRTFYLHYSFLDELLEEIMNEIADGYIQLTKEMDYLTNMPEIVRSFLLYFANQEPLYEKIICHGNFRYISDRVNQKIIDEKLDYLDSLGNMDIYTKNLLISYLNASALEMYRKWVSNKKRIPLEEFINLAVQLICHGIMSAPGYLDPNTKKLPTS